MRALFPVFVYCISLLSSQLLAQPVRNRLDFMARLHQLKEEGPISPDVTERSNDGVSIDRTILWRAILSRPPPPDPLHAGQPTAGDSSETGEIPKQRSSQRALARPPQPSPRPADARRMRPRYLPGTKPQSPPLPADRPKRTRRLPH